MKAVNAVIGGEGNGGIIYPELHYGRDALVDIALFPTHMDIDGLLKEVEAKYSDQPYSTIDGLKIEFGKQWVHLRKSNTEPVIRIYSEANSMENADKLTHQIIADMNTLLTV